MSGWIGVDLDGTLAEYGGWKGHTHIGRPVWPMVDRVKAWLEKGHKVKIFTARVSGDAKEAAEVTEEIHRWLRDHAGLPELEVTCVKDYAMIELWDDRCVQVKMNTGQPIGLSTRGL